MRSTAAAYYIITFFWPQTVARRPWRPITRRASVCLLLNARYIIILNCCTDIARRRPQTTTTDRHWPANNSIAPYPPAVTARKHRFWQNIDFPQRQSRRREKKSSQWPTPNRNAVRRWRTHSSTSTSRTTWTRAWCRVRGTTGTRRPPDRA